MTLEGKYRRLVRLFPAGWRDRNEEELVAALLDAAEPGRDSVPLAEAADLVRAATVLRFRASFAKPVVAGAFAAVRPAWIVGLVLASALAACSVSRAAAPSSGAGR